MPWNVNRLPYLMVLIASTSTAGAATASGILAHYTIDSNTPFLLEQISGERTPISGSFSRIDSPAGVALHLDGHSTLVAPRPLPRLTDADSPWSISCWLTLDALPWNEAPILDQQTAGGSLFFGVDAYGHLVAHYGLHGRDSGHIVSQGRLAPRTWTLATLSYHDGTLSFAVNGNSFPSADSTPVGNDATGAPLLIGHVRTPQLPYPPNAIHPLLPINYTLEGAIADLTVSDHVLTRAELRRLTAGVNAPLMQQAPAPRLPRWTGGPGAFGAFYTSLHYDPTWDAARRVGPDADVVVRFPQSSIQLVFWQGTSYIPAWVTENGRWYSDEFVEIYGKPRCPDGEDCEPMSDKQVRYSHVEILESTPARAVIRWRYALSEVENQKLADAPTPADWGAWADEYWTVYPDAVAVRRQVLWTDHPDREGSEFQESIVVIPAGETPEDNINLDALTLANLAGESRSYTWLPAAAPGGLAKPRGPDQFTEPANPLIQWVNLRSSWKPFEVAGAAPAKFAGINWEPSTSSFEWWNHWPVAQILSSGRPALAADRPSHSSLSHIYWPIDHQDAQTLSRILLTGLTTEQAGALAPRARSWLSPPPARVTGSATAHYDIAQRAYVIEGVHGSDTTSIEIDADPEHPLVNPAFVMPHWTGAARVSVAGASNDQQIQLGYVERLEGRTLVVYVPLSAQQPVKIILGPAP